MTASSPSARCFADVYRQWGWGNRVFTWHEAADIRHFHPAARAKACARDLSGSAIGATTSARAELQRVFVRARARRRLAARHLWRALSRRRARPHPCVPAPHYCGFLPNARVPELFARHIATVHVPRRFYVDRAAGHSDHSRLRGARLRHPVDLLALGGSRKSVPTGPRLSRCARPRRNDAAFARAGARSGAASRACRQRPGDHPCAPHLRTSRARTPGHLSPGSKVARRSWRPVA